MMLLLPRSRLASSSASGFRAGLRRVADARAAAAAAAAAAATSSPSALLQQRRPASSRAVEYMEQWVWEPHSDGAGYFDELARRPLRDESTGTEVFVVGVCDCSADSAHDVRDFVRSTRAARGPGRVSVCLDFYSAEAAHALEGCFTSHDVAARAKAAEAAARLGYPPDLLAQAVANFQTRGLAPLQCVAAAAAECDRQGVPVEFAGLHPKGPFQRLRYVYGAARELLAAVDPSVSLSRDLPNDMGLHGDMRGNVASEALAALLKRRPTPEVVRRRFETLDVPTQFFRYVQPTMHLVAAVRRHIEELPYNDGAVVVVVDAACAPMFYKLFKDVGLTAEQLAGVAHEFRPDEKRAAAEPESEHEAGSPSQVLRRLHAADAAAEAGSDAQTQAEFEVDLVTFTHLTRLRPDLLPFQQGLANVLLMNGMVGDALCYLRSLVDSGVSGAHGVLTRIVCDMVEEGFLDPDDPIVAGAMAPPPAAEAGAEAYNLPPQLLLGGPAAASEKDDGGVDAMVCHGREGDVVPTQVGELPEVEALARGEMGEHRAAVLTNALTEYQEAQVARHTPPASVQAAARKNQLDAEKLKFGLPALHPWSDQAMATVGADMVSQGRVGALQRYRPNSSFPVPPEQQTSVQVNSASAQAHLSKVKSQGTAVDYYLRESKRVRTTAPARSAFHVALNKQRKEGRQQELMSKAKERHSDQWERHNEKVDNAMTHTVYPF